MSITYPIKLPGLDLPNVGVQVPISSIRFKPRSVVALSASPFTLQQQIQAHQGQIWMVDIKLKQLKGASAQEWIAALLSLNGIQGTFYLGDPALRAPRGTHPGTPVVDGASQTGQMLNTEGWTITQTGILLAGDWIQLGTGLTQRIYRILKDINSDGNGKASLDIWPRLRESPANHDSVIIHNTMGIFRMSDNEMPWDIEYSLLYGFEFSVIEAI